MRAPTAEILQDIAPALQMEVADLLVIAGLPVTYDAGRPGPYQTSGEMGSLVAAASSLTPEQVKQVTTLHASSRRRTADRYEPRPAAGATLADVHAPLPETVTHGQAVQPVRDLRQFSEGRGGWADEPTLLKT
jgi:hypothetical protein